MVGGDVERDESSITPLLKPFVQAGGVLIVQNGARWSTYEGAFKDEITWRSGRSARLFGVHQPNRQQVLRLFPQEAAKTQQIRGKTCAFYVKGALLKDVPDMEACFSSVEEGYPAKENVAVAAKAIKKGYLLYIAAYNMCDSELLIIDFLRENAISRKQFEANCAEVGLWQAEIGPSTQDFQGWCWDDDSRSYDEGQEDPIPGGNLTSYAPRKRMRRDCYQ